MDACQVAFTAAVYLRIKHQYAVDVVFVCGKTRTAPKKLLSMPRLELQAAVLATRLSKLVVDRHDINISRIIFWTDSKTVLCWVNSRNRRFKSFVGHRIAEILTSTKEDQWRWMSTKMNPSDAATRAKEVPKINNGNTWLKGPTFLRQEQNSWPNATFSFYTDTLEEEITTPILLQYQASETLIEFNRFSSFFRLKRSVAWSLRAVQIFRRKRNPLLIEECNNLQSLPPLLPSEINEAEIFIMQLVQEDCFSEEKSLLKLQQPLNKKCKLYKLTPYVDNEEIIRASGRLDEAIYLPLEARRPIILPKRHVVSELIVKHYHVAYKHQNQATIINAVRQKFWIIGGKPLLKSVQRNCMECRLEAAKPAPPLMGQLSVDRITPYVRPFSYTGVDLFGPLHVTIGRRREKHCAVIFTCLTVRAVHIDIVDSLSTDAFLVCFRSFINRRGTPVRMRSDNGTNFIGAQRE
ncbi:uncharacterized protein LOC119663517 [Teleopsis dalmanni]|uniref:uncharacterized protein LOC119663517 n=2 Tax=Teleopsis dalmanni TaxID=139649 RepID=UPI0018CEE2FF|nr:uncharacterized protein LOC119663517 [Teleopsis dalmanni]